MKKFQEPEICVEEMTVVDVITTSETTKPGTQGPEDEF